MTTPGTAHTTNQINTFMQRLSCLYEHSGWDSTMPTCTVCTRQEVGASIDHLLSVKDLIDFKLAETAETYAPVFHETGLLTPNYRTHKSTEDAGTAGVILKYEDYFFGEYSYAEMTLPIDVYDGGLDVVRAYCENAVKTAREQKAARDAETAKRVEDHERATLAKLKEKYET